MVKHESKMYIYSHVYTLKFPLLRHGY